MVLDCGHVRCIYYCRGWYWLVLAGIGLSVIICNLNELVYFDILLNVPDNT